MSALLSGGEVLSVHIGGAGSNVGGTFWQVVAKEHHLLTSLQLQFADSQERHAHQRQLQQAWEEGQALEEGQGTSAGQQSLDQFRLGLSTQNLGPFFHETLDRHVPRAIFVDNDPAAKFSGLYAPLTPLKHFFRAENFLFGQESSAGVRCRAISHGGEAIARRFSDTLERELELCDGLQGVQLTSHLGGGSGSGLSGLLLQHIRDDLGRKVTLTPWALLPTATEIGSRSEPLEIYNAVLALPEFAELTDTTFLLDSEALYDICLRFIGTAEPGWRDLNHLESAAMAGLTACMRFPALHRAGADVARLHLRDLGDLLGSPAAPFAVPGFAPLSNRAANAPLGALLRTDGGDRRSYRSVGTRSPSALGLCQQIFRPGNCFCSVDPLGHHYTASLVVFRGPLNPSDIEQELNYARLSSEAPRAKEWSQSMPRMLRAKLCPQPDVGLNLSATFAGNTTAIGDRLRELANTCRSLVQRKAYLHVFEREGSLEKDEIKSKLEILDAVADVYEEDFGRMHRKMLSRYETQRDLGKIPFTWKLKRNAAVIFDTHKEIQVQF